MLQLHILSWKTGLEWKTRSEKYEFHQMGGATVWLCLSEGNNGRLGVTLIHASLLMCLCCNVLRSILFPVVDFLILSNQIHFGKFLHRIQLFLICWQHNFETDTRSITGLEIHKRTCWAKTYISVRTWTFCFTSPTYNNWDTYIYCMCSAFGNKQCIGELWYEFCWLCRALRDPHKRNTEYSSTPGSTVEVKKASGILTLVEGNSVIFVSAEE